MRKIVVVVVILCLMIGAATVWSQVQNRTGGSRGPGGMGFRMTCPAMALSPPSAMMLERTESLSLTEDQNTRLKEVLAKSEEMLTPLRLKASDENQALRTAILGADYDHQKVVQLAAAAQKAESAIVDEELNTWKQIRSIITDKQAEQLQQMYSRPFGGLSGPGGAMRNAPSSNVQPPSSDVQ